MPRTSPVVALAAVVTAAETQGLALAEAAEVSERPGHGLRGTIDGRAIRVTSRTQADRHGWDPHQQIPPVADGLEFPGTDPDLRAGFEAEAEVVGARALHERLTASEPPQVVGMRLPILRETRMPAVLLTVGAPRVSATAAPAVVDAVVNALEAWARPPADGG